MRAEFTWRGEKAQVSCSLEVLGSQSGIPWIGSGKKIGNSGGEEGLMILEFGGYEGGLEHYGISKGKGGGGG